VGFLVFPAAPPWLAVRAGLLHGVVRIRALDHPQEVTGTLQKLFDDNPVAAVPSLHAAYSLLVVLLVRRIWPRLAPLAIAYAVAMQFSVVYLGEHYVADLIAGDVLAASVWYAVARSRFRAPLGGAAAGATRRGGGASATGARPAAPGA
jgi:membrane-associated phospholipid phosphatase